MAAANDANDEITALQKRLSELDRERESVLAALEELKCDAEARARVPIQPAAYAANTSAMSNAEKIALFRSLFRGREDAGRLHRLHVAKRQVVIYDYVDQEVPLLAKMAAKRRAGYHTLGYQMTDSSDLFSF